MKKQGKYQNLNSLKNFYKPYKSKIVWFIIATLIANGIALVYPFLASKIILNLTNQNFDTMVLFCVYVLVATVINLLFSQLSDFLYSKISTSLYFDIRKNLIDKMIGLKLSTIYNVGSGYFTERLNEDSRDLSVNKLDIYKQMIVLIVNLSFIFYISTLSWQIVLIFLAGLAVIIFLEYLRVSKMLINRKKSKKAIEKVKLAENEIIKGLKEIKGLDAKASLLEKHSDISKKFMQTKYNREIFDKSMQKAIEISKAVLDFAILISAALYFIPMGHIQVLGVLIVYNYRGNVYDLIAGMAKLKDHFVNGELSAERVNQVILADKELVDEFGTKELTQKIQQIEFKDVAFEYVEGKPILKDIDLNIKANSLIGFVGRSGSGKTTIFSLLTNFYKKKSGQILLDGMPIEELSEKSLRQHISPVLQDPYIFNDTLIKNVKFAKSTASDEDVINACKQAELHDEILLMKYGYQTMIGENGANLSGGQKQRLEIARALLKDSDIILFDEATSALDKNNLVKINSLLVKLKKDKIILVIAHRLAIMRQCDTVYVLDEGKIIAHGKHEKLIEKSEYYQNLFKRNNQTQEIKK